MPEIVYQNRRAVQIENDLLRVTATVEGGHVAEILHKPSGINPLWTPPWPSIEPSTYNPQSYPEYGSGSEAHLLSGIMGHNICLDTFGAPSPEEAAAGITVHGEGPVALYEASVGDKWMELETTLPKSQLRFKRRLSLERGSPAIRFEEELENLSPSDRPIAWTQHVTLGPPFLERGQTQFRASATKSRVIDASFNNGSGMQKSGADFDWPLCPSREGGTLDLRVFPNDLRSGGFTAHLMDPEQQHAWFTAWSPRTKTAIGYIWERQDFPWLARWEENQLRTEPPWNSRGLACGMEFGVSPLVESRRSTVERGSLFGVPTYKWLPAKTTINIHYCAFAVTADAVPESVKWDGEHSVQLVA